MRTIGLIGGMSWESTAAYYRIINELVRSKLGGLHSAKIVLNSLDFAEIAGQQVGGDWDAMAAILGDAAAHLEAAGADFLLICTNTMHKLADEVQARVSIPLLHIADAVADRIKADGITRVGLLGTRFTMEDGFYTGRLAAKHGLDVITPDEADRQTIQRIIYDELCVGRQEATSKAECLRIMSALVARGAQGIVLGCTEIGLLVSQPDVTVSLFDTTTIHATAAVELALSS